MKITPLEIKEHKIRKKLFGYDVQEVEVLKEFTAVALEQANKLITELEEKLKDTASRLSEHEQRETMLKDTITTAQKMVDDIKNNAKKEAEIIIAETRQQADEITKHAKKRVQAIQEDILQLKKQRIELETSIKAILDYHSSILLMEEKESRKADEETEKLKVYKDGENHQTLTGKV
jgi:cell division initiation protein